jgi:hypothetical protein
MNSSPSSSSSSSSPLPSQEQLNHAFQQLQQQLQQQVSVNQQLQQQLQQQQQQQQQQQPFSSFRPRPPHPQPFRGVVGSAVDTWIRSIEIQLEYYKGIPGSFANERDQIAFAASCFTEAALMWWTSNQLHSQISTWQQFKQVVLQRFQPIEAGLQARQRLYTLKQGTNQSVTSYVEQFQRLLTPITDMGEADKINYFTHGLKPQIYAKVVERKPQDLQTAMSLAIEREAISNHIRFGTGNCKRG